MMTELMARSLTVEEIAAELQYHEDPAAKKLALAIIDGEIEDPAVQELETEVESVESERDEALEEVEGLKQLLRKCLEEVKDKDLIVEIEASI
jgi:hypothetical protein